MEKAETKGKGNIRNYVAEVTEITKIQHIQKKKAEVPKESVTLDNLEVKEPRRICRDPKQGAVVMSDCP
jgi:hypothetical protein